MVVLACSCFGFDNDCFIIANIQLPHGMGRLSLPFFLGSITRTLRPKKKALRAGTLESRKGFLNAEVQRSQRLFRFAFFTLRRRDRVGAHSRASNCRSPRSYRSSSKGRSWLRISQISSDNTDPMAWIASWRDNPERISLSRVSWTTGRSFAANWFSIV